MTPRSSRSSNRFSALLGDDPQDVRVEMESLVTQSQSQDPDLQSRMNQAYPWEEENPTFEASPRPRVGKRLDSSTLSQEELGNMQLEGEGEQNANQTEVQPQPKSQGLDSSPQLEEVLDGSEPDTPMPGLYPASWMDEQEYLFVPKPPLGAWETIKHGLDKYDKEICDAWNDELNTILTFTGLFSAAVTAFCIESFQTLSQNPADTTNTFLMAISQQLANSSSPVAGVSMLDTFSPNTYDVQLNVLYFISLALALSVSSICILAKQWIREYQKDIVVSPCDAARVRQARFESLGEWRLPQIIAALPVILLAALMLFFAGLLIQLWNVQNQIAAAMVTVVVALTVLLVIITTVVPALVSMQPGSLSFAPFRSPQAWIFFYIHRRVHHWYRQSPDFAERHPILSNWSDFDRHFLKMEAQDWLRQKTSSVYRVLDWVYNVLKDASEMEKAILWCLQRKGHPEAFIDDEYEFVQHVLNITEEEAPARNIHLAFYKYSVKIHGRQPDTLVAQHQAELLVQSTRYVLDLLWNEHEPQAQADKWETIQFACSALAHSYFNALFEDFSGQRIQQNQHILQDQLAFVFQTIFKLSTPVPHLFEWKNAISLLFRVQGKQTSHVARQLSQDIINTMIPAFVQRLKSASVLVAIGGATTDIPWTYLQDANKLFTQLDKIMVEWCRCPDGIDEMDLFNAIMWSKFRGKMIESTRLPGIVPHHLQLPDNYFTDLPGHGPLRGPVIDSW